MLDDLKLIHERDGQDALGMAERQWQQLDHEYAVPDSFRPAQVGKVVYAAMGGSALAAIVAKRWLDIGVPFEVVREYDIPAYVDEHTLCIIASYSGNTEESIESLRQAVAKGAPTVVVATGGRLQELAAVHGLPFLQVPKVEHMRYPIWYMLKAIVTVLEHCGLTQGRMAELMEAQTWLRDGLTAWRPDVATAGNEAKRIALELVGKSVVVYAGPKLSPAAYKWKISINENAKALAWWNEYPEFNHNEFTGWTQQPTVKPYAVIELHSSLEHERVHRRFEVSERLLSGQRPAPVVVTPEGDTLLQQYMYLFGLGDFVSVYLALLANINPTPLETVDKLKKELS
jgi:glucose/mannose-6-phosphate isomerase